MIVMFGGNSSSLMEINTTQNATAECMWCLDEELIGPLMAVFTGVILILSLIINLFICVYTLSHPKSLKKSSTMFLFNLALINLLMTVLFMPFMVVASAAEEWIIGQSDTERNVLCQITAFIFAYTVGVSVHTLAAISFDRFLSIVKPHHHKRYMTWKVALGIVLFIWVYSIVLDITPFFGLGEYTWSPAVGACLPIWSGNRDYVIYFSLFSTIPFTIIIVTTIWTYVFTRNFIKQDFERRQNMTNNVQYQQYDKSVYNVRIRNLIGIFGMLLLFNVITFSPYIIASVIGLIVGLDKIPSSIYSSVLILFLLNNVTNSIIQSYFRRDLRDTISKFFKKLKHLLSGSKSGKSKRSKVSESTEKQSQEFNGSSRNGDHKIYSNHTTQECDSKEGLSETVEMSIEYQTTLSVEPSATWANEHTKGNNIIANDP